MKPDGTLADMLWRIDGKGYKAYKGIVGEYDFKTYELIIDHVQGDPFSTPSRIRVRVKRAASGFLPDTTCNKSREIALRDFLTRRFFQKSKAISCKNRGLGNSGRILIYNPFQEVMDRSAMAVDDQFVEARFFMGLPASGRRISGKDAVAMFFEELPKIVGASMFAGGLNTDDMYRHLFASEDADYLRDRLKETGLVAFIADGALLPRTSGIDPAPLCGAEAVLFRSPDSLAKEFSLPNKGKIRGMGIPEGVTLIVGGGYHGKSTLLNAVELGVYNHIPGDGRELAVTVEFPATAGSLR
jgi:predicted ABC-class ATPase